ncbi:MAG: hypothetical protein KDC14_13270, partial [Planctomycetes bacterium]|nr:hypothetical protein [Planctomycetota bacterium]
AAGVVLCLRVAEECIGALVVESERRRDFSASEAERLAELVDADALHVRLAQFHAEHRRRHGRAVIADADSTGFRAFHAALRRARSASAPLVLCGPSGAGKRVFARWAWFESGAAEARRESTIRDWLADGARGPAYLTGLEQADAHDQLCLLRTLEDGADARDLAFGTREHPGCAARDGRLLPELSAWLGRELHFVPGFAQRREELSLLVEARLAELSCESARPLPHLDDGALALLWRQDWTGNWRELDARLHRLLQRETADEVTSDELAEIWRAAGDEAVARIPSREPSAELLQAALLSTATAGGRANKRRAALYLGWDPDTLAARLAEADLSAIDPSARGAAWSRRRSAAGGR